MNRQLVLGVGTGHCSFHALAELLNLQPDSRVTLESPPLLPWDRTAGSSRIPNRLARLRDRSAEGLFGDIASFYLPYVEDAIAFDPAIRIVCLKADRERVVAGFKNELENSASAPVNHWAKSALGRSHDPFRTHIYPQYSVESVAEGVRKYWTEYYSRADDLAQRFPANFRSFDAASLTSEDQQRAILDFVRSPAPHRIAASAGQRFPNREVKGSGVAPARCVDRFDPRRCIVLVPFQDSIVPACDEGLRALERKGYHVRRFGGRSAIDQARSQMASDALREGFEETMWIDSDVEFRPESVERLRMHQHGLVGGMYALKGYPDFAAHQLPDTQLLRCGQVGGLAETLYLGAGFLLVRRRVYLAIQKHCNLPICDETFGSPLIPFFQPMVRTIDDGSWYLTEDFSFCERARQSGFKTLIDTTIRLWHIGRHRYTWEDVSPPPKEGAAYEFRTSNYGKRTAATPAASFFTNGQSQTTAPYAWPVTAPSFAEDSESEPPSLAAQRLLEHSIPQNARFVAEISRGRGRAIGFLLKKTRDAAIVEINDSQGDVPLGGPKQLGPSHTQAWEAMLARHWDHRERIVPLRMNAVRALRYISERSIQLDALYLDALDQVDVNAAIVGCALDTFPSCVVVGDHWQRAAVRNAVERVAAVRGLSCDVLDDAWRIVG